MIENHWQLQEAKNKFSNVVDKAQKNGPQVVTKHGKEAVVVISVEEYNRLIKPKTNLVKFFQNSPLASEEVLFERKDELPRSVEL